MKERNILLTIEYDGTLFYGWQRQKEARTVQAELENALSKVCGTDIKINGTSRTDAGVHALGQRASFKGVFGIPTDKIQMAVNNMLSGGKQSRNKCSDVRITDVMEVDQDFHARFNSKGKMYRYLIRNMAEPDIFSRNYSYHVKEKLNLDAMKKAASYIEGTHDFACFQSAGGNVRETTVRTVYSVNVSERNPGEIAIEVSGDGFLYNMVRIIVGTLVEVGLGKKTPESLIEIIESADRQKAGHTAPPEGLYLVEVYYDEREAVCNGTEIK